MPVFISANMRWRVSFSISGSLSSILLALGGIGNVARDIAVPRIVLRSCEQLGSAVSGQTEMHSMHCVQFSGM